MEEKITITPYQLKRGQRTCLNKIAPKLIKGFPSSVCIRFQTYSTGSSLHTPLHTGPQSNSYQWLLKPTVRCAFNLIWCEQLRHLVYLHQKSGPSQIMPTVKDDLQVKSVHLAMGEAKETHTGTKYTSAIHEGSQNSHRPTVCHAQ